MVVRNGAYCRILQLEKLQQSTDRLLKEEQTLKAQMEVGHCMYVAAIHVSEPTSQVKCTWCVAKCS